jgi:hypothetical protein
MKARAFYRSDEAAICSIASTASRTAEKNQVRVFAFLEASLLLNLDIGRADGPADGVNAADAGLKRRSQQNQSGAFFSDFADALAAGDLLDAQPIKNRFQGPNI